MRLVLASTSPYRRSLLESKLLPLGMAFETAEPDGDESLTEAERSLKVGERAKLLALRKAESVLSRPGYEDAIVIAGDQIVEDEKGQVYHKPKSHEKAFLQLRSLSGQSHALATALAVVSKERQVTDLDLHTLKMHKLSDEGIQRYLEKDRPYDCAGSYKLECLGLLLFENITADPKTADASAVTGLPLMLLFRILKEHFALASFY